MNRQMNILERKYFTSDGSVCMIYLFNILHGCITWAQGASEILLWYCMGTSKIYKLHGRLELSDDSGIFKIGTLYGHLWNCPTAWEPLKWQITWVPLEM